VRSLRSQALLKERGQTCDGCAEKADLVARVKEVYDMPVLVEEAHHGSPEVRELGGAENVGSRVNSHCRTTPPARARPRTRSLTWTLKNYCAISTSVSAATQRSTNRSLHCSRHADAQPSPGFEVFGKDDMEKLRRNMAGSGEKSKGERARDMFETKRSAHAETENSKASATASGDSASAEATASEL